MNQTTRLLNKYQTRLDTLIENSGHDKTSGYPYTHEIKCVKEFIKDLKKLEKTPKMIRFCDLPKGARFRYPGLESVWIVLETHGDGLIVKWEGLNNKRYQSHCCFLDDKYPLETQVEVMEEE